MFEIEKVDKTIEAVCDRVQRKSKEGAFEDLEFPNLVSALADLISVREKLTDTKKLSRWTKKNGNSNAVKWKRMEASAVVADEISLQDLVRTVINLDKRF